MNQQGEEEEVIEPRKAIVLHLAARRSTTERHVIEDGAGNNYQ